MLIRNIVVCAVAISASIAYGQVQSGRLVGTIYDPAHAAVPNASVTVKNAATNISRSTVSGPDGDYVITPLDPGTY